MSSSNGNASHENNHGYIDPNFPNPDGYWDVPIIIYGYTPAFSLAVFAVVWFALMCVAHTAQTIRYRSWWFIPFSVGLLFEVVGYIARSLSAKRDPYHLLFFVFNYFFIVTAPVFLAAGIYTILSALIPRIGPKYSIVPPKVILWFFIVSDVIATMAQVVGASLIGKQESAHKDPTFANDILLAGLAYQVFAMGLFIAVAGTFLVRGRQVIQKKKMTVFTAMFTTVTLLIYLRTLFRLAETAQGLFGELESREVYFGCLEFAPVALAVVLIAVWHPGRCVGSKVRVVEEKDDATTPQHSAI